jgi:hypothetical protein
MRVPSAEAPLSFCDAVICPSIDRCIAEIRPESDILEKKLRGLLGATEYRKQTGK